jgi:hypothetical protein
MAVTLSLCNNIHLCLVRLTWHKHIFAKRKQLGIPVKIRVIIKSMYDGYSCQVLHDGKLPEPFPANSGVTQGYILPPMPLVLILGATFRWSLVFWTLSIVWNSEYLESTMFRKRDLISYSGEGRETPTRLGSLERANLIQVGVSFPSPVDGNRSSFWNVMFLSHLEF